MILKLQISVSASVKFSLQFRRSMKVGPGGAPYAQEGSSRWSGAPRRGLCHRRRYGHRRAAAPGTAAMMYCRVWLVYQQNGAFMQLISLDEYKTTWRGLFGLLQKKRKEKKEVCLGLGPRISNLNGPSFYEEGEYKRPKAKKRGPRPLLKMKRESQVLPPVW